MLDISMWPPKLASLVAAERLPPLGPGTADLVKKEELSSLSVQTCFEPYRVPDHDMGKSAIAGLWLHFDFLDESHRISQEIPTVAGSYWHAIMHRREPDFSNAKYWFRKVGSHAIFEPLCHGAATLAGSVTDPATKFLCSQPTWDPYAFVDLCENHLYQGTSVEMLCRRVALKEWELLMQYCITHAIEG